MAVLRWDRMTWDEFVAAVELYKQNFSGRSEEDFAYLRCRKALDGKPIAERASQSREIVRFLNVWKCGVNKDLTPPVIARWIRENAERLEALAHLTVDDPEVLDRLEEIQAIYDSLWDAARAEIRTRGRAATAKTLHMLLPGLFVMWDKNIERFANDYGDFMAEMHQLAVRMIAEGPYASAQELEQGDARALGLSRSQDVGEIPGRVQPGFRSS
jgi:hypothetical protein